MSRTSEAVVQVFSYDEPELQETLDAFADCRVPDRWALRYEACVTPAGAGLEANELLARQVDQAVNHPVFELVRTPPGKLSSRNAAHDAGAVDADVIVAGDADAPPLDRGFLEALLTPFQDADVVATNGTPVAPWTLLGTATNLLSWGHDVIQPHLNGQGHAFTADGWRAAGPFDVEAERNSYRVRRDEEFAFRRRLEDLGRVVDVSDARVYNDVRRARCRLRSAGPREPSDPYCSRLGTTTFEPRRQT